MPEILDEAAPRLVARDLVRLFLPDDPARLVAAADQMAAGPPESRRPILETE